MENTNATSHTVPAYLLHLDPSTARRLAAVARDVRNVPPVLDPKFLPTSVREGNA